MLVELSVRNYCSFKETATLSMVSVNAFKEHQNTHTIPLEPKFKLLKSCVIYGANASGKSNFISAMAFMKSLVLNSFRDSLQNEENFRFPLQKFLLNSQSEQEASMFELTFIQEGRKYRYGFEVEEDAVCSEWLFHTTSKEVPLFKRNGQEFYINKSSFKEGLGLEDKTRPNVLFLTLLAQLNGEIAKTVVRWFQNVNVISGIHDRGYKRFTIKKMMEDADFQKWLSNFISFLEISKITTEEEEITNEQIQKLKEQEQTEDLVNLLSSLQKLQAKQNKQHQVITWHRKYDKDGLLVGTVPFVFDKQESEGTKKLVYLLGPWYDTLRNNRVLLVDELDSRLHTQLLEKLLSYFHSEANQQAQLVGVLQDTALMDRAIFRRDQIWFIEKDQFGASDLYALSDFKSANVRNKTAFYKKYREGSYGAIPAFDEYGLVASPISAYGKEK